MGVSKDKIIIIKLGIDIEEEVLLVFFYIVGVRIWVVLLVIYIYCLENLFSFYNCVGEFFLVNYYFKGFLILYFVFFFVLVLLKSEFVFYEYLVFMK